VCTYICIIRVCILSVYLTSSRPYIHMYLYLWVCVCVLYVCLSPWIIVGRVAIGNYVKKNKKIKKITYWIRRVYYKSTRYQISLYDVRDYEFTMENRASQSPRVHIVLCVIMWSQADTDKSPINIIIWYMI